MTGWWVRSYTLGDTVGIDVKNGTITVGARTFSFPKLPKEILAIRDAGGLLPYTRQKLQEKRVQKKR